MVSDIAQAELNAFFIHFETLGFSLSYDHGKERKTILSILIKLCHLISEPSIYLLENILVKFG